MYKLLVLDMEDTFLDSKKTVLAPVEQGIRELIYTGTDVTFASGRFPASLWLHARFLGMKFPLVALNGGALTDPVSGSPIKTFPIETDTALKIARFAKERDLYLQFYGYNTLFVEELNEFNREWPLKNVVKNPDKALTFNNYRGQVNSIGLSEAGDFEVFLKDGGPEVLKAVIVAKDEGEADEAFAQMSACNKIAVTRTGDLRFDINGGNISKKTTLEYICNERGIARDEVAAAGYFDNDLEMIEWAGLGIAMGNAHEEVKRAAGLITDTNDRAGIARAIERIFLNTAKGGGGVR